MEIYSSLGNAVLLYVHVLIEKRFCFLLIKKKQIDAVKQGKSDTSQ